MNRIYLACALIFAGACADDVAIDIDPNLDIEAAKTFGSPMLFTYNSCEQLSEDLKKTTLDEMRTRLAIKLKNPPRFRDYTESGHETMAAPEAAPMAGAPAPAPVEGEDYSGTNNQEKGVDEADIIKVDGKFFYILNKSTLEIVDMPKVGELKPASTLRLETPGKGMLLMDDRAFVFANDQSEEFSLPSAAFGQSSLIADYPEGNLRIDAIDLSNDRKNPKLIDSYYFQGELLAARKIGNKIHVATYLDAHIPNIHYYPELGRNFYASKNPEEKDRLWVKAVNDTVKRNEELMENFDFLSMLPSVLKKDGNKLDRELIGPADCARTFGINDGSSTGFLSLITIEPKANVTTFDIQRVRGNPPIVYASNDQFILASPEHQPWWFFNNEELNDQTTIHRFDVSKDAPPAYKDSVRVPGTLHDSFSLSEHKGYLRVATTTSPNRRSWLPGPGINPKTDEQPLDENHLFILGDDLGQFDILSSIEGLAPGEKIWSARFSNDLGFLVTFKQIDPLFTLDLSDPKKPEVAGSLKVPGVSTYLQDIGHDHLLAVGYGGDGDGLDFQTTVSLFDVTDFKNPKLADTLSFAISEGLNHSWSNVSSEANRSHLAVNYFSPVAMTAIPLNTDRFIENPLDPSGGQYEYISKLTLVNTAAGKDLSIHGEIDHSQFYNKERSFERRSPEIRRSYFVGDYLYAISPKAITATRLSDMTTTGTYELP